MTIVYISPYPPLQDGLARYAKQFADSLRARGHRVGIVATAGRPDEAAHVGAILGMSPARLYRIYQYLRQERPEIIHVQYTIPGLGLAAVPLWFLLGYARAKLHSKVVVTFHEVRRETALLGPVGAWYLGHIAKRADHVTVHTAEAARLLAERCMVPNAKISHILHPLYIYERVAGGATTVPGPQASGVALWVYSY
jgi:hypothetical protein